MQSVVIPFGKYAPDQSDYTPGNTTNILNVMPVADGWGPINDFTTYGTGLGSTCRGFITVRRADGDFDSYAGTTANLYKFNRTTSVWDDVTRSSGGDYAVPSGFAWSMVQFGSYLIATNGADVVQFINVDSGTNFAALAGSPPVARYVGVTNEFVVLLALSGELDKLQWSGIGDSEYWTIGQRLCDKQQLPDGGEITGFIGYETGGVVMQRNRMRAMTFAPSSGYTFTFSVLQNAIGSIGEPNIVAFRNTFFFIADGGFYQGAEATPIGSEWVDKYLVDTADLALLQETQGAADPVNKIVWWVITKSDASTTLIGYHWLLKRWTISDMSATFVASGATPGYTMDSIDSFGTIDTLPYSLDSRAWNGGDLSIAGFNSSGDFGFFQGNALEATIETNDISLGNGKRSFVQSARLISDAASGVTGKIAGRDNPGATLDWTSSLTPSSVSGKILARKRGRTHRSQWTIAAATTWANAVGVELIYRLAGNR